METLLLIALLGGGIIFGGKKLLSLNTMNKTLDYAPIVKFFRFHTATELRLGLDMKIINPSDLSIGFSRPYVQIFFKEQLLTSSQLTNSLTVIQANAESLIKGLEFRINVVSKFPILKQMVTALTKGSNLTFTELKNAVLDNSDELTKMLDMQLTYYVKDIPVTQKFSLAGITLGYSPLSAIDRRIIARPQYDKYFPTGSVKKKLRLAHGSVEDTVFEMINMVNRDYKEVAQAAHLVKAGNTYSTAKKIFEFLFDHIKYNLERGEILNSPAVSYHYGQVLARQNQRKSNTNPVDCDDFSIFAASFLKYLGHDWAFRIASYDGINYAHVYCVIPANGNRKEIVLDPVYFGFNMEKSYKKQKTFSPSKELI